MLYWVEQHLRECVPPCLDSNTWGHILLLHYCLGKENVLSVLYAHCDESQCLGSTCGTKHLYLVACFRHCCRKIYLSSLRLLWSVGSAHPFLGWYDDKARSHFSPDNASLWAELYSAQLCLFNMHIILYVESRWTWIYFNSLLRSVCELSLPGCFSDLEWLWWMSFTVLCRMGLGVGCLPFLLEVSLWAPCLDCAVSPVWVSFTAGRSGSPEIVSFLSITGWFACLYGTDTD